MVFVFPLITVVMARNSVVQASTSPISSIIAPIMTLDSSFIPNDICVIDEKQKEANTIKNTRVFLLFNVFFLRSSVNSLSESLSFPRLFAFPEC